MVSRRVQLRFDPETVSKPITYHLVKEYDIVPNILQARIFPEEEGQLIMDLKCANESELLKGIEFLRKEGINVKTLTDSIIHDEDKCINCGACTGVCKTGALTMDSSNWQLILDNDKCLLCEMCLSACARNALSLEIG